MGLVVKAGGPSSIVALTRGALVRLVRERLKVRTGEAKVVVDAILNRIRDSVAAGDTVELRDLGTFRRKAVGPRWGRDFRSARPVRLEGGWRLSFRVSRKLRRELGGAGMPRADATPAGK
jgi:nucleoid DNA-binding protein